MTLVLRTLADHRAFTLRAFCQGCDRSVELNHQALADRCGWDVLLLDIRRRLRCQECGAPARALLVGMSRRYGRLNRVYEHVDPSHSIRYTGRTRERAQRGAKEAT